MISLSDNNQADVVGAFNSTSTYLDDLINIYNHYFAQIISRIYHTEIQLIKSNPSETEPFFLDLDLSITIDTVSTKIYNKRDNFIFEIFYFPFLDGYVLFSPFYGVNIRVCSNVDDFNNRNTSLTSKLLKQGYRYHKLCKAFSKLYYRHSEMIAKYNICLKTLLQQGISEPVFYGDLFYKFKKNVGNSNFIDQRSWPVSY